MKVVFGGTFDPVHVGHLRMATELVSELGVESVHLMPCFEAVHKEEVSASASERLEMLKLATSRDSALFIDDREINRGKASYTIDSLHEIRSEIAEEPLCIVMGTDSALNLASWRCVEQFSALTHIVVVKRPGESQEELALVHRQLKKLGYTAVDAVRALHQQANGLVLMLELTQLDVSSTAIRQSIRENKSIRYLVMGAVEEYICDNSLYQN